MPSLWPSKQDVAGSNPVSRSPRCHGARVRHPCSVALASRHGPRAFVPLTPRQLPQDSAANSMTRVYSPDDRHVAGESYMSQRLLPIVVIDVWRDGEGRQRVIRHEDLAAIHALDGLL